MGLPSWFQPHQQPCFSILNRIQSFKPPWSRSIRRNARRPWKSAFVTEYVRFIGPALPFPVFAVLIIFSFIGLAIVVQPCKCDSFFVFFIVVSHSVASFSSLVILLKILPVLVDAKSLPPKLQVKPSFYNFRQFVYLCSQRTYPSLNFFRNFYAWSVDEPEVDISWCAARHSWNAGFSGPVGRLDARTSIVGRKLTRLAL